MNNYRTHTVKGRQVRIYLPALYVRECPFPVTYLHTDKESLHLLSSHINFADFPFITAAILSENRLNDYTPWQAPSLDPKYPDFGGKGEAYLFWLTQWLKPFVDKTYHTLTGRENTAMIGRSLGGLVSLYGACLSSDFGVIASISPSVWYEDFCEYFSENLQSNPMKIAIISGEDEGRGTDNIRNTMGAEIQRCYRIIRKSGHGESRLFLDQGGHHEHVMKRYMKAFDWVERSLSKL